MAIDRCLSFLSPPHYFPSFSSRRGFGIFTFQLLMLVDFFELRPYAASCRRFCTKSLQIFTFYTHLFKVQFRMKSSHSLIHILHLFFMSQLCTLCTKSAMTVLHFSSPSFSCPNSVRNRHIFFHILFTFKSHRGQACVLPSSPPENKKSKAKQSKQNGRKIPTFAVSRFNSACFGKSLFSLASAISSFCRTWLCLLGQRVSLAGGLTG